jgi:hypothetical protein
LPVWLHRANKKIVYFSRFPRMAGDGAQQKEATMPKKATVEQIKAEIERRIKASTELDGDCRGCGTPTPRWAPRDKYPSGWSIDVLPSLAPGCEEVITKIVLGVMQEYELAEDTH